MVEHEFRGLPSSLEKIFLLILSCSLVILNSGILHASACGVTTHNEVNQRALSRFFENGFKDIILRNQGSFQLGSAFPDWGYPDLGIFGGSFAGSSEFSHWRFFILELVDYIKNKTNTVGAGFGGSYKFDKATEELIAFTFGVTGHCSADITWHGLHGTSLNAFIPTLGQHEYREQNYPGSCSSQHNQCYSLAHSEADTGGDVLLSYSSGLPWLSSRWTVPMKDLLNVFGKSEKDFPDLFTHWDHNQLVKEKVGEAALIERISLLLAEAFVMKGVGDDLNAGELLLSSYVSPFLTERFEDWILGGIDDMATAVSFQWELLVALFQNPNYRARMEAQSTSTQKKPSSWMKHMRKGKAKKQKYGYEVTTSIGKIVKIKVDKDSFSILQEPNTLSNNKRSAEGHSQHDGRKKISFVDQGEQTLRYTYSSSTKTSETRPQLADPDAVLSISSPYSQLGTSFQTADLNGDNIPDIIIGAPAFSKPGQPLIGAVFILYGRQKPLNGNIDLLSSADMVLNTHFPYSRFGQSIAVLDLDLDGSPDLCVSAPSVGSQGRLRAQDFIPIQTRDDPYNMYTGQMRGEVYVYFGGKGLQNGTVDLVIQTDNDMTNLGWVLKAEDLDGDGNLDLFVGSPFSNEMKSSAGKLSIFLSGKRFATRKKHSTSVRVINVNESDWEQGGEFDGDWYGYHSAVGVGQNGERILIVSAPTKGRLVNQTDVINSAGKIYGYHVGVNMNITKLFSLSGSMALDKTGQMFSIGCPTNSQTLLAISSPTRNGEKKTQVGEVLMIPLDSRILHGDLDIESPQVQKYVTLRMSGGNRRSRFGWRSMFTDINRDGIDDFVVSEPLSSTGFAGLSHEAGALYAWYGGEQFPRGNLTDAGQSASFSIRSRDDRRRLGMQFSVSDLNQDKANDFLVSSSWSPFERAAGSLWIFYGHN